MGIDNECTTLKKSMDPNHGQKEKKRKSLAPKGDMYNEAEEI